MLLHHRIGSDSSMLKSHKITKLLIRETENKLNQKMVKIGIAVFPGSNCDRDVSHVLNDVLGVQADFLWHTKERISGYDAMIIPGGFAFGDRLRAGIIAAHSPIVQEVKRMAKDGTPVLGICNGFQILTKAGILPGVGVQNFEPRPDNSIGFSQTATLMTNDSGKFEDRWIYLKPNGRCVWSEGIKEIISLPVAHGEGKFVPKDDTVLKKLKENGQIIFRYCNKMGDAPVYPENPNGSIEDIAAIADQAGRVFGLMPHPERHFLATQHPHWTRLKKKGKFGDGAKIFQNGVNYVKEKLF